MHNFFNEKLFIFSGPRICLPLFGAIGILRHQHLLIDLAVIATILVAHVDDLREVIGIGIETETGTGIAMIVIERGEAGPPKGIAEGTTVTAPDISTPHVGFHLPSTPMPISWMKTRNLKNHGNVIICA
jgi:hypothetical protein